MIAIVIVGVMVILVILGIAIGYDAGRRLGYLDGRADGYEAAKRGLQPHYTMAVDEIRRSIQRG